MSDRSRPAGAVQKHYNDSIQTVSLTTVHLAFDLITEQARAGIKVGPLLGLFLSLSPNKNAFSTRILIAFVSCLEIYDLSIRTFLFVERVLLFVFVRNSFRNESVRPISGSSVSAIS